MHRSGEPLRNSLQIGICRLAIAAFVLSVIGCGDNPAAPSATANPDIEDSTPTAALAPTKTDAPEEISDEDCFAFAKKLEAAVIADDGHSAGELFSWDQMIDEALQGLSSPERPNQFIEDMRIAGSVSRVQLPNTLGAIIKNGGSYRFIRIRSGPEGKRILLRLLGANGGVNYHEVIVGKTASRVVGRDIYIYLTGEKASETLRRLAIQGAAENDADFRSGLNDVEREFGKNAMAQLAVSTAFREGRFADCLAACDRMSPIMQKEKSQLLFRVVVAGKLNNAAYISAIDAFRAAFPNDACVDLVAIDSLFAKKQFDEARQAIDRLDKSLGGDPYLHVLRANSYLSEGKFDDADREAKAALEEDASLTDALWALVTISLSKRDFARTAGLLTRIRDEHHLDLSGIATDPNFAEFVKSPEYQKWQAEKSETP